MHMGDSFFYRLMGVFSSHQLFRFGELSFQVPRYLLVLSRFQSSVVSFPGDSLSPSDSGRVSGPRGPSGRLASSATPRGTRTVSSLPFGRLVCVRQPS